MEQSPWSCGPVAVYAYEECNVKTSTRSVPFSESSAPASTLDREPGLLRYIKGNDSRLKPREFCMLIYQPVEGNDSQVLHRCQDCGSIVFRGPVLR